MLHPLGHTQIQCPFNSITNFQHLWANIQSHHKHSLIRAIQICISIHSNWFGFKQIKLNFDLYGKWNANIHNIIHHAFATLLDKPINLIRCDGTLEWHSTNYEESIWFWSCKIRIQRNHHIILIESLFSWEWFNQFDWISSSGESIQDEFLKYCIERCR